jgi:hypothetical protein
MAFGAVLLPNWSGAAEWYRSRRGDHGKELGKPRMEHGYIFYRKAGKLNPSK